ncbi:MAG TPA: hypothetical protein VFY14_04740 [Streptomyces sp.]|nr:hypothetical protein [Streptomyces sp.]
MNCETLCAASIREAELLGIEDSPYLRDYLRLHHKRHSDPAERLREDRAAVFRAAVGARALRQGRAAAPLTPKDPVSLESSFPWTERFTDDDHPLHDPAISFAAPPPTAKRIEPGHSVDIRAVLDEAGDVLVCYPGSWGVQQGIREEPFRGETVDYHAYAPTYLASTARYGRDFAAAVGLSCDVVVPVVPTVCQYERKLYEFALLERPDSVHPAMVRSGVALAEALCDLALAGRLPRHLLLFSFSYGAAMVVQHLTMLTALCARSARGADILRSLRDTITLVLVASNVDYPEELPFPMVAFRSPLDSVVMGNEELSLRTSCRQDFAAFGLPLRVRGSLMKGDFEAVRGDAYPVELGPGRLQWNCPLPGAVGVDEHGAALHHFDDLRDGHDIRMYQPVFARADVRRSLLRRQSPASRSPWKGTDRSAQS